MNPQGNPHYGIITIWDSKRDIGEIRWEPGHTMSSDVYLFKISNGPAFIKDRSRPKTFLVAAGV